MLYVKKITALQLYLKRSPDAMPPQPEWYKDFYITCDIAGKVNWSDPVYTVEELIEMNNVKVIH